MSEDYAPPMRPLPFYTRESESFALAQKKFGDEMIGVWEYTDLPADAVVTHLTLMPYRGERAVVAWKEGRTLLPDGDVAPGETAEAAIKRIAAEQAAILDPVATHIGHFRCVAGNFAANQQPGAVTYRALYGVEVGSFADFPTDQSYERRVIAQRDLNVLVRATYLEFRREYTESLDRYLLQRIKANQSR